FLATPIPPSKLGGPPARDPSRNRRIASPHLEIHLDIQGSACLFILSRPEASRCVARPCSPGTPPASLPRLPLISPFCDKLPPPTIQPPAGGRRQRRLGMLPAGPKRPRATPQGHSRAAKPRRSRG